MNTDVKLRSFYLPISVHNYHTPERMNSAREYRTNVRVRSVLTLLPFRRPLAKGDVVRNESVSWTSEVVRVIAVCRVRFRAICNIFYRILSCVRYRVIASS